MTTNDRYGEPNSWSSPPHSQSTEPVEPTAFTNAQFVCWMQEGSFKFDKHGSMSVSFTIPPNQVENAMALRHLAMSAIPVSVDVQPYRRYEDKVAENMRELEKVSADLMKTEVVDG